MFWYKECKQPHSCWKFSLYWYTVLNIISAFLWLFQIELNVGKRHSLPSPPFPPFFPRYFLVGKTLTTLADECAFLKAVITSYINLRENGRKIKTFYHSTPDPHTLKKSRMGNWRVLAFARLMLHFEEKGKTLFHLFCPRQIDGKFRTPLPPKEKNRMGK